MYKQALKTMKKRFQGVLAGAVIGDCLGAPFEFAGVTDMEKILKVISPSSRALMKKRKPFCFTDDTAMTRSVCNSLLSQNKFDGKDMATHFMNEYRNEPGRGYGGVTSIFNEWYANGIDDHFLKPASEAYGGTGSYGNGAAMRVAPVALFCHSEDAVIKMAKNQALLTHSAKHGYNGAILQALAVFNALKSAKPLDTDKFLDHLISLMAIVEDTTIELELKKPENQTGGEDTTKWSLSPDFTFVRRLHAIKVLLKETSPERRKVVSTLGNDVSAQEAVPAAIYCFLHNSSKSLEDTVYYAISLGGDTDTVATMAGAMAGAYFTCDGIPKKWMSVCEGVNDAVTFADKFYDLYVKWEDTDIS